MAIAKLSELLADARARRYAVGYFEAWDTYSLEGVAEAAETERSPVALGFGGMMMDQVWLDRFGIEPLGAYVRSVAERLSVPAATILNEVWEFQHAERGIGSGFNTVMLNTCELPYQRNLELTRALVQAAHANGVEVQAELGRLPNYGTVCQTATNCEDETCTLTDPAQAREFAVSTKVDFLAVSIGNVHMQTEGAATIDLDRLRAIRNEVDIPLVIHGGSGFPDDVVASVIAEGVALFHVGSMMKRRYLEAASKALNELDDTRDFQRCVGSRKEADFLMPGKRAVREAVAAAMRLYGSSGKA